MSSTLTDWNNDSIRVLERQSIRDFLRANRKYLRGRVLDVGCGKQPYRGIVEEAGGRYYGFDRPEFPGSVAPEAVGIGDPLDDTWDAVMMTQVLQYVLFPPVLLARIEEALKPGGALVMTGPTNWAEVEPADLWRFTLSGVRVLMHRAELDIEILESRASVSIGGFAMSLGWGVVARKR